MLILKLGGAAITDKAIPNTLQTESLAAIAADLAAYTEPLILIHGAGSFGHIIAKQHHLQNGYQNPEQLSAITQLQSQLAMLNTAVMAALQKAGMLARALHPASLCTLRGGRINNFFIESVQHTLALGFVPVLYGDCVYDSERGFGILSGDQLVTYLANQLGAERVAFGTNVGGVWDADEHIIPHIHNLSTFLAQADHATQSKQPDVTGGMRGKLTEINTLRNPKTQVTIFDLTDATQRRAVLQHQNHIGTQITLL